MQSIDPFHLSLEHVWLGVLTKLLDVGSRYLQWRMPMGKKDFSLSSLSDLPQVPTAFGSIVCLQIILKSNKTKTYSIHKHVIIVSMLSGTPSGRHEVVILSVQPSSDDSRVKQEHLRVDGDNIGQQHNMFHMRRIIFVNFWELYHITSINYVYMRILYIYIYINQIISPTL